MIRQCEGDFVIDTAGNNDLLVGGGVGWEQEWKMCPKFQLFDRKRANVCSE